MLGLLALILAAFRTVAVKHDGSDYEENTSTDDDVQPTRRLQFVQSGFGFFITFLVEEASEGKAGQLSSFTKDRGLKVGASANDKSGVAGSVWVLKFTEIKEDLSVCLSDCTLFVVPAWNHHLQILLKALLIGQVFHVSEVEWNRSCLWYHNEFCFRVWADVCERVTVSLNNDVSVGVADTGIPCTRAYQAIRANLHAIQSVLNF